MTRGVSTITGTSTVATLQKEHRKGASVKMTDHPILTTIARILNGYGTLPALLSYDSSLIGDIISSASTTLTSKSYVDSREGYWESSVANFAALPTGTIDGETRVTLDDNKIYVWDSTTVAWILAGSGGGAGTIYKTVQLGSDCNTRTCSLSSGSWNDSKWLSVYLNGVLMEEGASADYTASSTGDDILFNFDLNANDKIFMRVDSIDYYNPAWGSVDANIVPDTNNSYDLGSASKSFKNLYASGTAQIYGNTTLDGNLTVNGGMAANRTVTAPLDVAINGSVTPQLVSYHTETGFVVEANASSASTTRPFGFVTTNALASTSPNIIVSGVVDGFTGLATNTEYYLSDTNGEISATQGTRIVPVGRAISATQLLINFGTKKYIFQPTISTNADWSQGTIATGTFYVGFKPEKIKITGQTVTQGTNTRDDIFDISVMGESNAMNGWKFLYFNNTSWGATSWDPIQGDTTMALSNPGGTNSGYWNLAFSTKTDTYITIILTYTLKSNGGCSISISNTLVEVEGN